MYFNTDVSKKDRKRLVLTGFRGVDAASPMYRIDKQRASAMRNFISVDGYNHKRNGWKQIGRIKDSIGNSLPINGFFKFVIAHREIKMAYAGTKFFIEKNGVYCDMDANPKPIPNNVSSAQNLISRPCQMFIDHDRAYFVGMGDMFVLGDYDGQLEFRRVYNDENTYIPTTTVNIPPAEKDYYDTGEEVKYDALQTLDDINVLQSLRKNSFIGSDNWAHTATAGTDYVDADITGAGISKITKTYQLDGAHIGAAGFKIEARHYKAEDGTTKDYTLSLGARADATCERNPIVGLDTTDATDIKQQTITFDTKVKRISKIGTYSNTDLCFNILKSTAFSIFATGTSPYNTLNLFYKIGTSEAVKIATATRLSEYVNYALVWEAAIITAPSVSIPNTDNVLSYIDITCNHRYLNILCTGLKSRTYTIVDSTGTADEATPTIATCVPGARQTWGTVDFETGKVAFYVNPHTISGEANITVTFSDDDAEYAQRILSCKFGTLFGSKGNADTLFVAGGENYPNYDYWTHSKDFTYFESKNICSVGTSNTAIMCYQRLGDESLAIFKEDKGNEPTLYIRTGVAPTIDVENRTGTDDYYYTAGKFITQGAISNRAVGMLNGDAIFLSKDGVYGVQINSDSIAVEQRVARERSRLINPILQKHADLSKACSIIHSNKFYLALDNYVYVADARYVFSQKGDMTDTYNYEWWVWDNCPVRTWFELDGELCFGTEDGRVCKFSDNFIDRKYEEFSALSFGDTLSDGVIRATYNAADVVGLECGDLVELKGNSIYRLLFDATDMTTNTDSESDDYCKITVSEENINKLYKGMAVYADSITGTSELETGTKYYVYDIDKANMTFVLHAEHDENAQALEIGTALRLCVDLNGEIVRVNTGSNGATTYFTVRNRYATDEESDYTLIRYNNTPISANGVKWIEKNVVAEWITPALDMGANDYIKTFTRFSLATEQITDGAVVFGWETKNNRGIKEIDSRGLDVMTFNNLNFGKFTFDTGFDSAFTHNVKTDFNFIVFRFTSDNPYDCCVHSLTVEYKVNRINKGVF